MRDVAKLMRRFFRHRWLLFGAVALTVLQCACELILPLQMAEIVNGGLLRTDMDLIGSTGMRMVIVCVLLGMSGYGAWLCCAVGSQRFGLELRESLYEKICGLSLSQVSDFGSGSLITRMTSDVNICAELMNALVQLLLEPVVLLIGGILLVSGLSRTLGFVFTAFCALQVAVMLLFIRKSAPIFVRIQRVTDQFNRYLQSTLRHLRLTKAYQTESWEADRSETINRSLLDISFTAQKWVAVFNPLVMLIMNFSVVFILAFSGAHVADGTMPVGNVMAAVTYSEQILLSIMISGKLFRYAAEAAPSAGRISEVLGAVPEIRDGERNIAEPIRMIELQKVDVAFPASGPIIEGLDFSVHAGEMVAVVGPMGCGKTTLARLLNRTCEATGGQIRLDGAPIDAFQLEPLRRRVALVEKGAELLEGTICENIAFGREDISPEEVRRAAEIAGCGPFVERLPQGYDAPVLSMGTSLSGGERQRVAIARALAGRPDILVLDDATSALDYETEARILNGMRSEYPRMAIVLTTQRIPSARRADRICFLSEGRVEASGTHGELTAKCPAYGRFCGAQPLGETP